MKVKIKICFLLLIALMLSAATLFAAEPEALANQDKMQKVRMLKELNASAGSEASSSPELPPVEGISFVRLFQGLALCIGVFLIGVHFYKKYVLKNIKPFERSINIIDKIPLSSKSHLCLVEVMDKKVLLAVGSDKVSFYHDNEVLNSCAEFLDYSTPTKQQQTCETKVN